MPRAPILVLFNRHELHTAATRLESILLVATVRFSCRLAEYDCDDQRVLVDYLAALEQAHESFRLIVENWPTVLICSAVVYHGMSLGKSKLATITLHLNTIDTVGCM